MSETIGDVMHRLFGMYDYVAIQSPAHTSILKWNKTSLAAEGHKFKRYSLQNGMELSKRIAVPSDRMSDVYLVFEV